MCAVELRKGNGLTENIIMSCKQRHACNNNKAQNFNQKRASDQKSSKHGNNHEWSGYQCKPLMLEKSTCRQWSFKYIFFSKFLFLTIFCILLPKLVYNFQNIKYIKLKFFETEKSVVRQKTVTDSTIGKIFILQLTGTRSYHKIVYL